MAGDAPDPQAEPEELPAEPDPEADVGTEETKVPNTEDKAECKKCEKCSPRQQGSLGLRPAPQSRPEHKRGYDYQHWVCPWHPYMPEAARIGEWSWQGVDFDGLHPAECHLYEAKHGYEGFLEQDDWSAGGRPKLQRWAKRSARKVFDDMATQARRQRDVVAPHYPKVHLTWAFSSMATKLYVYDIFLKQRCVPPIGAEVLPFTKGSSDE